MAPCVVTFFLLLDLVIVQLFVGTFSLPIGSSDCTAVVEYSLTDKLVHISLPGPIARVYHSLSPLTQKLTALFPLTHWVGGLVDQFCS